MKATVAITVTYCLAKQVDKCFEYFDYGEQVTYIVLSGSDTSKSRSGRNP